MVAAHTSFNDRSKSAKEQVVVMTKKVRKAKGKKPGKVSKKASKIKQARRVKSPEKPLTSAPGKPIISIATPTSTSLEYEIHRASSVFSIEPGNISGDTTIGDLIVAFPRTRHVLMKHGLRFDVEEAGSIYMTLSVFSALQGLGLNNLIQELVSTSKEAPPPLLPQPSPQIPAPLPSTSP